MAATVKVGSYLCVPRMARASVGRAHGGEDVRLAVCGKSLLAHGISVGPDGTPKRSLREQYERGTEGLRVQLVLEGQSGQVSAVPDEARILRVHQSLLFRNTVLVPREDMEVASVCNQQWGKRKIKTI